MKRWFGLSRMTRPEYEANLNGLNMFFGAMLGLVMAGTERLSSWRFAVMLLLVSGTVVCILYITAARQRLTYAALAIGMALFLPSVVDDLLQGRGALPDKVQPTLLVWALMMTVVELYPRERSEN